MASPAQSARSATENAHQVKRLTDRAEQLWNGLRGDAAMPRRDEWSVADDPNLAPNLFIVELHNDEPETAVMSAAGGALIDALGQNPIGRPIQQTLPPPLRSKLLSAMQTVGAGPAHFSGCYPNAEGNDIVFRAILLPLAGADGGAEPEAALGAISFKLVIYD